MSLVDAVREGDDEAIALRDGIEAGGGGELLARAKAAVQRDDKRQGRLARDCSWEEDARWTVATIVTDGDRRPARL